MTYLIAKNNLLDYRSNRMMFSVATPYKVRGVYEGAWVIHDDNDIPHYILKGSPYEQNNFKVFNFPE